MTTMAPALDLQIKSVLVATDFSPASAKPLSHALAIARRYDARLCVAHVVSSMGLTLAGPEAVCAAQDAAERDAEQLGQRLATAGIPAGQYKTVVRCGDIWEQLESLIHSEQVDLVILGTHARHGVRKVLMGSVAEQIFRRTGCPVLTIGPGAYEQPRVDQVRAHNPFLFATDLSDASLQALPHAVSFANQFCAQLALFHVVFTVAMPEDTRVCNPDDLAKLRERECKFALQQLERMVEKSSAKVRPKLMLSVNTVSPLSDQILSAGAELNADLIILGLRPTSRSRTSSHLPWSTAYEVVCRASCPVLTVRAK